MVKKTIVLAGHENFGKTKTLQALTGKQRATTVTIDKTGYVLHNMSNDDDPKRMLDFVGNLDPAQTTNLIITLCPNFHNPKKLTLQILSQLKAKGYQMNFWVLEKQFGDYNIVTPCEIVALAKWGCVEVFGAASTPAAQRAKHFKAFIRRHK